jgi:hypothetical protein
LSSQTVALVLFLLVQAFAMFVAPRFLFCEENHNRVLKSRILSLQSIRKKSEHSAKSRLIGDSDGISNKQKHHVVWLASAATGAISCRSLRCYVHQHPTLEGWRQ